MRIFPCFGMVVVVCMRVCVRACCAYRDKEAIDQINIYVNEILALEALPRMQNGNQKENKQSDKSKIVHFRIKSFFQLYIRSFPFFFFVGAFISYWSSIRERENVKDSADDRDDSTQHRDVLTNCKKVQHGTFSRPFSASCVYAAFILCLMIDGRIGVDIQDM